MTKIKFDILINPEGLSQLEASGRFGAEGRSISEKDAKIVHSFCAENYMEAYQKYYDFMDWGTYQAIDEEDEEWKSQPFDIEEFKQAALEWEEKQRKKES